MLAPEEMAHNAKQAALRTHIEQVLLSSRLENESQRRTLRQKVLRLRQRLVELESQLQELESEA